MIQYVHGNMFHNAHQVYTCTVNCVGVMGAGVAKEVANRYPEVVTPYQTLCRQKKITIGQHRLLPTLDDGGIHILMFATKKHWRNPSQVEWIEEGLMALRSDLETRQYRTVVTDLAMPPLGCGNGGLDFDADVRHLIEFYFGDWAGTLTVYVPH